MLINTNISFVVRQPLKLKCLSTTIRAPVQVLINQVTSPKFSFFLFEGQSTAQHSTGVLLCRALSKFYEDRTAPPISSLPRKRPLQLFICNKYIGGTFYTCNKYFCDMPQIPSEHWRHFLPGNLTKQLYVISAP